MHTFEQELAARVSNECIPIAGGGREKGACPRTSYSSLAIIPLPRENDSGVGPGTVG